MTRTTLFLLGLLVAVPMALAAQAPMNLAELVNRRGVYLHPQTLEAYTGTVVAYHENGEISERGTLQNGRFHGVRESYYLDAKLEVKEAYRNGTLHGPFESYFRSGRLADRGTYTEGRLEGPYEAYWSRAQGDVHAAHGNASGAAGGDHEGHTGTEMTMATGDLMERGTMNAGRPCGEWYRFLPRNTQGLRTGETVRYPPCPAAGR